MIDDIVNEKWRWIVTRINVYEETGTPECGEYEQTLVGWFCLEKAQKFYESTTWNGDNHVSDATGTHTDHEMLYRTAGGRWVLHSWSQWIRVPDTYAFIDDDAAYKWLLAQHNDEAAEKYFGDIPEEPGPAPVGRPKVGAEVLVRLGEDLLAKVDAEKDRTGESRAATLRRLVAAGLTQV